ncbi:hypothetical protein CUMW_226580 [Citrus unshiu]|uniref:Pentacotripeptide-repeat region of PRORP domain-containing protein n=1 Tax=Citrus unshiu TaxID=55188 RepID=A0A2H5QG54_CITUN|nr:hypothetical protein CUMW_226580 [Citrus unshiu]
MCKIREIHSAIKKGICLDVFVYSSLINGLCTFNRLKEAVELFDKMVAQGITAELVTYNPLIHDNWEKQGRFSAMALLQTLERDKYELNIEVYSLVIDGLCRVGRWEEARKKLDQLSEKGLVPGVVTYNILINGLCKKGMIMEADKLLVQMKEKGCFPDSTSFNTVIQGFLVKNETDRASSFLKKNM